MENAELTHLFDRVKQAFLKLERGRERGLPPATLEILLERYFVVLRAYHYTRDAPRLVGGDDVSTS